MAELLAVSPTLQIPENPDDCLMLYQRPESEGNFFLRVRLRSDKPVEEIDTLERVKQQLYEKQAARRAPTK